MDKHPRNPRVKKRLLEDFGEEGRHNIGPDGSAVETDDKSTNTKFYHLRDLPKKIYVKDDTDGDDGESNDDFSPVVSEYIPSPERRNLANTPSSSLGGDSEYIEAVQSKLSRTPSSISNVSSVLNQIDFVASPSEVFKADNNNRCVTTPKTKNQKQWHENLVNISLKPARFQAADFVGQPTSANSSPRAVVTCRTVAIIHEKISLKSNHMASSLSPPHTADEHTKTMQITELDTTLKPEETLSALDLTFRSSVSDDGSISTLDPVSNINLSTVVASSCVSGRDLPFPVNNVLPSYVNPRMKEPTSEIAVHSNINLVSNDDPDPNVAVPFNTALEIFVSSNSEPEKDAPVSEIQPTSANSSPGAVVTCTTVAIIHEQISLKSNHIASSLSPPHTADEHTKAMQITELDTTLKPEETLSALDLTLRSSVSDDGSISILDPVSNIHLSTVVARSFVSGNDLPFPVNNDLPSYFNPRMKEPASEIAVHSNTKPVSNSDPDPNVAMFLNTDPKRDVVALEIFVSSNSEPEKDAPVSEIFSPSNTGSAGDDGPISDTIMLSHIESQKDVPVSDTLVLFNTIAAMNDGLVPDVVVSSNAKSRNVVPALEIIMPSYANVPVKNNVLETVIVLPFNVEPRKDLPPYEDIMIVPYNDVGSVHVSSAPAPEFNADTDNDASALVISIPSTVEPENNESISVVFELTTSEPENHAPPSECENNNMSAAENPKKRTRKRKLDVDNWQSNKNKKLKDSGLAYKGCNSKKDFPAKTVGPACACKKLCSERISPQKRKELFDKYYKIGNHEFQWQFIIRNVEAQDIKRITLNRKCNRTQTLKYFFYVDGVKEVVCKNFFLNTLNISDTVIFTALEKVKREENLQDLRGSHKNRPHTTNALTEERVVEHINLFPTVEAHYVRKDSEKRYLHDDLNISKMYRLYKKWFAVQNYCDVQMATARQYRKIFNTQFNYSFFKPKKDQCAICRRYEQAEEETKMALQTNYDKHIQNKETVRNIKDTEKGKPNDSETIAIFDLEKVLYIPKSEVGVFYYKRKYPVYNFTVFDAGRKLGNCFMWHHTIAKRGAIEIGSCLLKFLENEHERSVNQISFYSDGCRGQNKNRFIFALFLYAAAKFKMNITHRFFETGHSQNEGDSMHACIERELKKHKYIYMPEQMYGIAMNAKVTGETYNVVEMGQSDFVNIKLLIEGKNWLQDSNGNKIMWSNIMEVNASHTHPGKLKFKYNFEDEYMELNTCVLPNRARRGRQNERGGRTRVGRARGGRIDGTPSTNELPTVPELQRAYNQQFPVSKALHSDLLSLCKSHDIPRHYHSFYESLACETDANVETHDPSHEDSLYA